MSKRCSMIVHTLIILIIMILVAFLIKLCFFSGLFIPRISLIGDESKQVEVNTNYKDQGAKANFRFKNYNHKIKTYNNCNLNRLGTYKIIYSLKESNKKVVREIRVVDTIAPNIKLIGDKHQHTFENSKFIDLGVEVKDNYDKNLSKKVITKNMVDLNHKGTYKITYQVSDQSGNTSSIHRIVSVHSDPTRTKIYYNHDRYDNTLEEWWFNKSEKHNRPLAARNEAYLAENDAFYLGADEKVIYLTFDEGGNDVTYIHEIADVLNENDVKATFFLTRNYIKTESRFMNELVEKKHLIANHTWHHYDMPLLASSDKINTFVNEISETEKTYLEVTGKQMKKIFRFPKGAMSQRSLKIMRDLGYKTFFWSHAYYDYGSEVSKKDSYQTMIDHYHNGAIYLLHPSNKGNYLALDDFIKTMKEKGYEFRTVENIGL
ncbi:MAG: polysaccharide deacetylase family protein [Erysipelotrichaceae bacterium]